MSYNGLGAEGGLAIIDMLKENCFISHIDLSNNHIGSAGAFGLAEMLSFNNTVTHIDFSGKCTVLVVDYSIYIIGNDFDDKAVEPISEIIKVHYITLQQLYINVYYISV